MQTDKTEIKAAIIDLYQDYPNQGMRSFQDLLKQYRTQHNVNLTYQIFDLRGKNEVPDLSFDLYISSGGPGSPLDSEGSEWERLYWNLIDAIDGHNQSNATNKKHVLFVCHSFQLMCRRLKLGDVNMRHSESFGIFPTHQTEAGLNDPLLEGLADPFFIVDSREWQVINPDEQRFAETGSQLLALEKERPHVPRPRAMMAIRFNDYFFGTQFHPEADPEGMKIHFADEEKKQLIIAEYGQARYDDMLQGLAHPEKIVLTHKTIIPKFIQQALQSLQEV
ncbi:GMP synthase-like glutamine amidotransferase [Mucilaginibacter gracilis]|uniref:GMP synthase-like glutamine amidotransferase n=1 Tax=Mucilaginibacter gracilis TaxID=423350 RepID=A0A495IVX5_9SPHI|nr:GMP synthase [Mucilaginibacter gracilis]RKR80905.1 GMP synthase-like glutamine amidotransferase [Mucilaginibacter gracilis]